MQSVLADVRVNIATVSRAQWTIFIVFIYASSSAIALDLTVKLV